MDGTGRINEVVVGPQGATDAASRVKKEEEEKKLKKACTDFEAFFVYYVLKTMRQTVPKGGLLGNSPGMDTYYMMMDQKIAENVAKKGDGLGLQKLLFDQLSKKARTK
ncbi:MAG TPA: rod-binding protein [Syntrophales bacterium]|nr:rod-binding protein [Syntrophobacterales bacterium]HRR41717.1 rod-binding protein [Syntrophales bacterium]HRT27506.1 rod-binding protein [Syntrophales bacterium]HRT70723.1 rod-binding protein [Syntrophales bacterium]